MWEQSTRTSRHTPVWLGQYINKTVTHFLDGRQKFCRHSSSPSKLLCFQAVSLCPNPRLPEEEELGLVHSLFITGSEWGGGTGRAASCAGCFPELDPQMPRKQHADCILLFTFLGLSGLAGAVTRTYHIGIVEEYWNYVPQGKNVITGKSFEGDKWVNVGSHRLPGSASCRLCMGKIVFLGWS